MARVSMAYNMTEVPSKTQLWGGTALISTNKAVHRIIASGKDTAKIGRWCWTRFRGRNNVTLRVFSAYCPNSPTGPISVKAQQRRCFNGHNETRCPTVLFFKHLKEAIRDAQPEGHNILVMLGGNMYMKGSELATMLKSLNLREAKLHKFGNNGPSTIKRNKWGGAIDRLWIFNTMTKKSCGYLEYDSLYPGIEHHCLWVDISYKAAFGHNMPAKIRPKTRRLHCRDPRIVDNYVQAYLQQKKRQKLLEKACKLEANATYPIKGTISV
jgi:hypothetical protein